MEYITEIVEDGIIRYPAILYKYRSWKDPNHQRILLDSIAFMSSPADFKDISDCNVPEIFPLKSELYDVFLQKSIKVNVGYYTRKKHREYAKYWSKNSPLANPKQLSDMVNHFNYVFNHRFGVLSLTANPDNNDMWENYGDGHKGFCVGFDSKKLFEVVGGGGYVHYIDELPIIDFVNDDFKTKHIKNIFFKEKRYSLEQEYRVHKMWESDVTIEERNIKLLNDSIVKIIFGKDMPENDKSEILEILRDKHPNVRIAQMT